MSAPDGYEDDLRRLYEATAKDQTEMELDPLSEADLLDRVSQLQVPPEIQNSLAVHEAPTAPGQIGRVAWDNTVFLFLVRSVTPSFLDGWVLDTANSSDQKWEIQSSLSSFNLKLYARHTTVSLPAVSFDATVGILTPPAGEQTMQYMERLAGKGGIETTESDPSANVLQVFGELREGTGMIADFLAEHGFTLSRLKATLGVESQTAFAILRGEKPLTENQVSMISEATGVLARKISAVGPATPDELLVALSEHRYRAAASAASDCRGNAESEGLRLLARGALSLAARKDSGAPINWHHRVERFIEASRL